MAHVMLIENRVTYLCHYGREEAIRICFTLCSIERENPEWNCDYFRQNFLFSKDEPGLTSYIQELWNEWIFGSINYFSLADTIPDEVYGIPESRCDYYQTTGISSSFNDATTYSDSTSTLLQALRTNHATVHNSRHNNINTMIYIIK